MKTAPKAVGPPPQAVPEGPIADGSHALPGLSQIRELQALPTPLDEVEMRERGECEEIIRQGWHTFLAVGRALTTIRDKHLYRDVHATFDEYCREKWEFSKTHANRLIDAASVDAALTPIGVKLTNESQARPLAGLPPQKIPGAWKRAEQIAGDGKVTAKVVRKAVEEFKTPSELSVRVERPAHANPIPSALKTALTLILEVEEAIKVGDAIEARETLGKLRKFLLEFARQSKTP